MILINQRLESKTTVSVLAHFLGTAHNTRAEIHRLSREGTKSLCTNSGFAAPPPVAPQARWVFGPSSGEYHFPAAADLHPSTLISLRCKCWEGTEREFQKCRSCSRTGWALMAEQQLHRAVLVPGELEAAGSSCTGTKDNCTRTQSSSSREATAPLTAHLRLLWFWNSISRLGTPTRILKANQGSRGHHSEGTGAHQGREVASGSLGQGRLRNHWHLSLPEAGYGEAGAKYFFYRSMGKGQDKDHSKGDFDWVYGKKKGSEVQQWSTEASCSGDWNLHPQRCSNCDWTWSQVTWLNLQESPALSRKIKAWITSTNPFQPKCF